MMFVFGLLVGFLIGIVLTILILFIVASVKIESRQKAMESKETESIAVQPECADEKTDKKPEKEAAGEEPPVDTGGEDAAGEETKEK